MYIEICEDVQRLEIEKNEIRRRIVIQKVIWTPALQILSHLKLTGKRLGFLINFNVPLLKNSIKRIIL